MHNAFTILGVAATATVDEIKAKWRELCMIYHPDRGGDAAQFHDICTAYKVALASSRATKICMACAGVGKLKQTRGLHSVDLLCMACRGTGYT